MLRLLALIARGFVKGNRLDYEPASAELAEWLRDPGGNSGDSPEERHRRVMEFVAKTGGEAG